MRNFVVQIYIPVKIIKSDFRSVAWFAIVSTIDLLCSRNFQNLFDLVSLICAKKFNNNDNLMSCFQLSMPENGLSTFLLF